MCRGWLGSFPAIQVFGAAEKQHRLALAVRGTGSDVLDTCPDPRIGSGCMLDREAIWRNAHADTRPARLTEARDFSPSSGHGSDAERIDGTDGIHLDLTHLHLKIRWSR